MDPEQSGFPGEITRRGAISAVGVVTAGLAIGIVEDNATAAPTATSNTVDVHLRINGKPVQFALDPRVTLLDLLREHVGLTGTKKGCDHGQCGACTVLANGRRINSCLSLAVTHEGDEITTVEGLAANGQLHPVQAAFIEHDGFQCGYCTPGQICSAVALMSELKRSDASVVTANLAHTMPTSELLTDDELRERMSGNICRCGAYQGIVAAVKQVASR
jgi:xanthine dehydrogenase YagT iron-sulfur-binding subunit